MQPFKKTWAVVFTLNSKEEANYPKPRLILEFIIFLSLQTHLFDSFM